MIRLLAVAEPSWFVVTKIKLKLIVMNYFWFPSRTLLNFVQYAVEFVNNSVWAFPWPLQFECYAGFFRTGL